MSTSAYRIERKVIKKRVWSSAVSVPTFNCYHDSEVKNFLIARAVSDQLNENGGRFTIHVDSLKELFSEVEVGNLNPSIDTLSNLREDLENAEKLKTLSVEYEIF